MPIPWAAIGSATSAFKDIGSTFGSIGSLFGKSNSAKSLRDQFQYNLGLQREAQAWNEYVMKNRYQWQSEDLEKAGINKLYGLGSAPSPALSGGSVGLPDYSTGKNGRLQRAAQLLDMAQNWSAKRAQIENMNQQTQTEWYNTQLKALEATDKEYQTLLTKKELDHWEEKRKIELEAYRSQIEKNISSAGLDFANAEATREQVKTARQERKHQEILNKPEETQAKDYEEWLNKNPRLKRVITWTNGLKSTLGVIGTAGAAMYTGGMTLRAQKLKAAATAAKAATKQKTARGYNTYRKLREK